MGILSIFKKKEPLAAQVYQQAKINLLKDKELAFEVLSENLKGKKLCPMMLGAPCMGDACMLFQEYTSTENATGKETKFKACSLSQANSVMMQTNFNINQLHNTILTILETLAGVKKQ